MDPKISLLIPCYNAAAFLPTLLEQASNQSFHEIICYDDGSSDHSAAVAEGFGAQVIRGERNRGPGYARNRLLAAANCDWIHFHDADDWIGIDFVRKMSALISGPNEGAVCALKVHRADRAEPDRILRFPQVVDSPDLVAVVIHHFIHLDSLVLPRHLVVAAGGFVEQMRLADDLDLLPRLAEIGVRLRYLDEPLATWIKHPASLTHSCTSLQIARYNRWYLHRCYRKLRPIHRRTIGDKAMYFAWMYYYDARGAEARAYREESRRWLYLAGLCQLKYLTQGSRWEQLIAGITGPEPLFIARRAYADIRAWFQKRLPKRNEKPVST
jgi:glycosyltransferase involved in cell wall biosynthesis